MASFCASNRSSFAQITVKTIMAAPDSWSKGVKNWATSATRKSYGSCCFSLFTTFFFGGFLSCACLPFACLNFATLWPLCWFGSQLMQFLGSLSFPSILTSKTSIASVEWACSYPAIPPWNITNTSKNEACEWRTSMNTLSTTTHQWCRSYIFKMFSKTALWKNISQCLDVNEAVMKFELWPSNLPPSLDLGGPWSADSVENF